jgi:tetratricopeptide (TPR) repeat protein
MKRSAMMALLAPIIVATVARAQEDVAAKVFRDVQGSVVALENVEGGGTGILLERSGVILTNAHVIASPLPFKCKVAVKRGSKTETVTFKKVIIMGVHPKKDLALVKIDIREHKGLLQCAKLATRKASPGMWVCAIGNPAGGGMVLNKTITTGVLSGVDRELEGVSYYQVDAAINPGNSGGPLCDKKGRVLGLVTLKLTNVDNVGFAIPLFDLNTAEFIPLAQRKGDPEKVKQVVEKANKYYEKSRAVAKRKGKDHPEAKMYRSHSAYLFHIALADDPGNASLYYNVGMLLRGLDEDEVAAAYLLQAVELEPWGGDDAKYYRELGFALAKQKKADEAKAAWEEGLAKFPEKGVRIWDDMAVYYFNDAVDHYEAAYAASVAVHLKIPAPRARKTKKLLADATAKLDKKQKKKLKSAVDKIPKKLRSAKQKAGKLKKAGKPYVTDTFATYVKNSGNLGSNEAGKPTAGTKTKTATTKPKVASPKLDLTVPPGWQNLLREVKPSADAVHGKWKFVGKALCSPLTSYARLQVPAKLPKEYDLKMIVERKSNKKEFAIGFVRDGRQSVFLMDIGGNSSGLTLEGNGHRGEVFTNNRPATIHCMIRHEGLLVSVDGKRIFFERTTDPLPTNPSQWQVGDRTKLFLGSNMSKYYIHKLILKPYVKK